MNASRPASEPETTEDASTNVRRSAIASLYVHVPFCAGKCDYCAFYSIPSTSQETRQNYLARLQDDFRDVRARCAPLSTIFVGGGTPSILDRTELHQLLSSLSQTFELRSDVEWTVECNPDSLTEPKAELLAEAGVNRISLGVQSLDPTLRGILGRQGNTDALEDTVRHLRRLGVSGINVDLIYAIPGQSISQWTDDVRRMCDRGIDHLSTYALTREEGTRLGDSALPPVDDVLEIQMWDVVAEEAHGAGLERYEVSNLARPGAECRHNNRIWHGATYIGCGPAAASFDGQLRWTAPGSLEGWLDQAPPEEDHLPPEQRAAEILAFGLRTVEGWRIREFSRTTGRDPFTLRPEAVRNLIDEGMLIRTETRLYPTRKGLLFADYVAQTLL